MEYRKLKTLAKLENNPRLIKDFEDYSGKKAILETPK